MGSGLKTHKDKGYTSIDIRPGHADITQDMSDPLPFLDNSVDEILCEAAFEHLYRHQQTKALKEWYRILKPEGIVRIEWLPDFDAVIDQYKSGELCFDYAMGALTGCASDEEQVHKDLFTKTTIGQLLEKAGFKIIYVDYCVNVFKDNNPWPLNKYGLAVKAKK